MFSNPGLHPGSAGLGSSPGPIPRKTPHGRSSSTQAVLYWCCCRLGKEESLRRDISDRVVTSVSSPSSDSVSRTFLRSTTRTSGVHPSYPSTRSTRKTLFLFLGSAPVLLQFRSPTLIWSLFLCAAHRYSTMDASTRRNLRSYGQEVRSVSPFARDDLRRSPRLPIPPHTSATVPTLPSEASDPTQRSSSVLDDEDGRATSSGSHRDSDVVSEVASSTLQRLLNPSPTPQDDAEAESSADAHTTEGGGSRRSHSARSTPSHATTRTPSRASTVTAVPVTELREQIKEIVREGFKEFIFSVEGKSAIRELVSQQYAQPQHEESRASQHDSRNTRQGEAIHITQPSPRYPSARDTLELQARRTPQHPFEGLAGADQIVTTPPSTGFVLRTDTRRSTGTSVTTMPPLLDQHTFRTVENERARDQQSTTTQYVSGVQPRDPPRDRQPHSVSRPTHSNQGRESVQPMHTAVAFQPIDRRDRAVNTGNTLPVPTLLQPEVWHSPARTIATPHASNTIDTDYMAVVPRSGQFLSPTGVYFNPEQMNVMYPQGIPQGFYRIPEAGRIFSVNDIVTLLRTGVPNPPPAEIAARFRREQYLPHFNNQRYSGDSSESLPGFLHEFTTVCQSISLPRQFAVLMLQALLTGNASTTFSYWGQSLWQSPPPIAITHLPLNHVVAALALKYWTLEVAQNHVVKLTQTLKQQPKESTEHFIMRFDLGTQNLQLHDSQRVQMFVNGLQRLSVDYDGRSSYEEVKDRALAKAAYEPSLDDCMPAHASDMFSLQQPPLLQRPTTSTTAGVKAVQSPEMQTILGELQKISKAMSTRQPTPAPPPQQSKQVVGREQERTAQAQNKGTPTPTSTSQKGEESAVKCKYCEKDGHDLNSCFAFDKAKRLGLIPDAEAVRKAQARKKGDHRPATNSVSVQPDQEEGNSQPQRVAAAQKK